MSGPFQLSQIPMFISKTGFTPPYNAVYFTKMQPHQKSVWCNHTKKVSDFESMSFMGENNKRFSEKYIL